MQEDSTIELYFVFFSIYGEAAYPTSGFYLLLITYYSLLQPKGRGNFCEDRQTNLTDLVFFSLE